MKTNNSSNNGLLENPSIPTDTEVLIVGYGPAGAALTCLLGQYGVNTLVIDKAPDVYTAPRAIAMDNEGLRILQSVGLSDDAFAKVPIPYVTMICPVVGEFARVNMSGTIDDHPKLVTYFQPAMERALRSKVADHTSVTAATGVELLGFVEKDDRVLATLKTADGVEHTVRAKYLVGADGASSKVRHSIGQDFKGKTYAENWLIVDALNVPGKFDHIEFFCDHKRPGPHMIAPDGRTRWEFMLHSGESREEMEKDETVRRLIAPWTGGREVTIERKAVYRFHARSCERFSQGRVFLVGDAAHITPPFVGQGLVAGLRDVANLSWKLAWVLRGKADPSILETYDEERRPHAKKMIELAKFVGSLVMSTNAAVSVLVHGALKATRNIPAMRSAFGEFGMKPKPVFERGLFVRGRVRLRRGGLFPQFRVQKPDGQIGRSDDVLGPSLALVGLGADVDARLSTEVRHRWTGIGGTTVSFRLPDERFEKPGHGYQVLGNKIPSDVLGLFTPGWCAVVRPDHTILHEGPVSNAERIVAEATRLLDPEQRVGSFALSRSAAVA